MKNLKKIQAERIQRAVDLACWAVECHNHKDARSFAQKALLELDRVKKDSVDLGEVGRLTDTIGGHLAVTLRQQFGWDLD
jgi:hypothetical protein